MVKWVYGTINKQKIIRERKQKTWEEIEGKFKPIEVIVWNFELKIGRSYTI